MTLFTQFSSDLDDSGGHDGSSFKSCASTEEENFHDQPEAYRRCQGDQCFVIGDTNDFSPSWASLGYMVKQNFNKEEGVTVHGRSCLGVYQCPNKDCAFVSNPVVPRKKVKHAMSSGPKKYPLHCIFQSWFRRISNEEGPYGSDS